jgi:outer membrane protein OmpA-like peptidoglycan-associated protein
MFKRLFTCLALLLPSLVLAQNETPLNAEFFRPAGGNGYLGVTSAKVLQSFQLQAGFFANFAKRPFVIVDGAGEVITTVIDNQAVVDVVAAIGLFKYVELGFGVPVALFLNGDPNQIINNGGELSGQAIGDIRVQAKLRILGDPTEKEGFFLSLTPQLSLPTGDENSLFGAVGPSGLLTLSADIRTSKLTAGFTAGPRLQKPVDLAGLSFGPTVYVGLGGAFAVNDKLALTAEAEGELAIGSNNLASGQAPAEARVGVKLQATPAFSIPVGVGFGIAPGIGAPEFRVLAGFIFTKDKSEVSDEDLDSDGLTGKADKCPTDAEDKDGFEDSDGCPDPDNDKDTVVDTKDECPDAAGSVATNGCPDTDADKISDRDDQCPEEPGTPETKGCPNVDKDKDGIVDNLDSCPTVFGVVSAKGCPDKDGDSFADEVDSCPTVFGVASAKGCPDKDGDSFADKEDKCPETPGVLEMQGCPDKDGDTITDKDDLCPEKPGPKAFKGCPDTDDDKITDNDDVCPDKKEDGSKKDGANPKDGCPADIKAVISGGKIIILDKVYFDIGKDTLQKKSFPVLNAVVKILVENPNIKKIEVQGHTDDQGDDASNLDLSDRRAKRVAEYLKTQGINAERIAGKGYGETLPLSPIEGLDQKKQKKEVKALREKNRRVEFVIIEQ